MKKPECTGRPDWVAYSLVVVLVAILVISLYILVQPSTDPVFRNTDYSLFYGGNI